MSRHARDTSRIVRTSFNANSDPKMSRRRSRGNFVKSIKKKRETRLDREARLELHSDFIEFSSMTPTNSSLLDPLSPASAANATVTPSRVASQTLSSATPSSPFTPSRHQAARQQRLIAEQQFSLEEYIRFVPTFKTYFVPLNVDDAEALRQLYRCHYGVGRDVSLAGDDLHQYFELLMQLEKRLDKVISLCGSQGAFIRLSRRSPKDSILECVFSRKTLCDSLCDLLHSYAFLQQEKMMRKKKNDRRQKSPSSSTQNSPHSSVNISNSSDDVNHQHRANSNSSSTYYAYLPPLLETVADDPDRELPYSDDDLNNHIRLLFQAMQFSMKIRNGREAIEMLSKSERVYVDLNLALEFPQMFSVQIAVREFQRISLENEFRVFVFRRKISAMCQYCDLCFFPEFSSARKEELLGEIESFLSPILRKLPFEDCVLDLCRTRCRNSASHQWLVIEINPFTENTGGTLFSWSTDSQILSPKSSKKAENGHQIYIESIARSNPIVTSSSSSSSSSSSPLPVPESSASPSPSSPHSDGSCFSATFEFRLLSQPPSLERLQVLISPEYRQILLACRKRVELLDQLKLSGAEYRSINPALAPFCSVS